MNHALHPLLVEAFERGCIEHDGRMFELHSNIPVEVCQLLYRQAEAVGATSAIEIGMAYGVSTITLADALRHRTEAPVLVSIDPLQHELYDGVALGQLRRAGFVEFCELLESPSHTALPSLLERGLRVDLALIDGLHTFDQCLVDFFYIDLLLREGGVVVFDDTWMPGVQAAVEFVVHNRAYAIVDRVARRPSWRERLSRSLRRRHSLLGPSSAVALRKEGADSRPWHHYVNFDA